MYAIPKFTHFLHKYLLIVLLMALFAVTIEACNTDNKKTNTGSSVTIPQKLDTADAYATYQQLITASKNVIDTFYRGIYTPLGEDNRYELLLSHMNYYATLSNGDRATYAFTEKVKGYAYNYFAKYDSAEIFFLNAINIDSELNLKAELADAYAGLASNYSYKGDFKGTFAYRYKSLAIYEQLRDSVSIVKVRSDMAIGFYYQKEYNKAIETAIACLEYFQNHNDIANTAYMQTIIATCYFGKKEYRSSLDYSRSSLAIRRNLGLHHDIAESLNNISLAYMGLKMWDSAVISLSESLNLMQESNDNRQIPIIRQNLAVCLSKTGKTTDAIALLNKAIAEATTSGQKDAIASGHNALYRIYRDAGDYEKALASYQKYKDGRDSLYNEEKTKTISELNIKYETEKKEKQIVALNLEKKLESTRKTEYLIISAILLIAGTIIILLLTDRNRKSRLLIEKVKLELKDNKHHLESFTNNLIAKNKFIEELERKINEVAAVAKTKQVKENEYISDLYQFKILTEDDWLEFKMRFDKAYPGYINKLRERFPELAPGEQRQFLLIRLNVDNKECANMLGISVDSVKKNRYRLKKRFNLAEEDNLDEFVRSFN